MKPNNSVQINDYYQIELLMLDRNTWNHQTAYKLFVLRIVKWSYNSLLRIIISYLKPNNCYILTLNRAVNQEMHLCK